VGWEKVACWNTKAAISLKRVQIEESYYGGPIETHQRSFEQYHPRPSTASSSPRLGVRNPTQNSNRYTLKSEHMLSVLQYYMLMSQNRLHVTSNM